MSAVAVTFMEAPHFSGTARHFGERFEENLRTSVIDCADNLSVRKGLDELAD
jgi:hypothetical protein